jgi:hypothetical protein
MLHIGSKVGVVPVGVREIEVNTDVTSVASVTNFLHNIPSEGRFRPARPDPAAKATAEAQKCLRFITPLMSIVHALVNDFHWGFKLKIVAEERQYMVLKAVGHGAGVSARVDLKAVRDAILVEDIV